MGMAAPLDVFTKDQLQALVAQARANLTRIAIEFSNGNADLAKGIEAQHRAALSLYEQNRELPVELNLGKR
jgi:fructose/tagatose bisphosphate aldolase